MSWAFELIDVHTSSDGVPILQGVDLGATMGEVTAIVGPVGSGKTAVFRLVTGLDRPDAGAVFVAGQEISTARGRGLTKIQRRLGVVFAGEGGLFAAASVRENLGIAMRAAGRVPVRRIDAVTDEELARFGLLELCDRRPGELTAAQQRCLAVARALALRSPLVVVDGLDEWLDADTARTVCAAVREDARERGTSWLVTLRHAGLAATVADAVVGLRAGTTARG